MDALTRYHYAKEREESAVLYINDAYLEALNSLENLEAENARLREELADAPKCETCEAMLDCDECLRADVSHKKRRQLSAENAKLREQSERLFDKTLELGTENSKLRELCKLCEREAENAKLREERDTYRDLVGCMVHPDIPDQLAAENAKLRELVSGLEHCVQGFVCDCCPLYDPSGTNHRRCESLERELGIEVDA